MKEDFMHTYTVTYKLDGKDHHTKIDAVDAGGAFARIQKDKPGAVVISAERYGRTPQGGEGWTTYEPPPVQRDHVPDPRPARALKAKEEGCEFPFYEESKSRKGD